MSDSRRWMRGLGVVLLVAVGLAAVGCGNGEGGSSDSAPATERASGGGSGGEPAGEGASAGGAGGEPRQATLVLDFLPGPVHAGIYYALREGWYEQAGIDLRIIEPTSTADTLRLIDAGKAEFGIADGIDVALQIAEGRPAKAILGLTQRPSGGLIALADSDFDEPADFRGGRIGVTGVPSDDAVLETILAAGGLTPDDVEKVTIGFNGARALANRRVDGFIGFIPADGVQLELDGSPIRAFPFDEYGGPRYPGLVVFSTEDRLAADPELAEAFVAATVRGYEAVIADPELGIAALLDETVGISRELAEAGLEAYEPLFVADAERFGVIRAGNVAKTMDFLAEAGLIEEPIPPERYATDEFLPEGG